MTLTIRARLTLWYTAVLSLALAAAAAGFYAFQWRLRLGQLDEELRNAEALVARLVPLELDEGLALPQAAEGALEDLDAPGQWLAVFDSASRHLAGQWDSLPHPGTGGSLKPGAAVSVRTPEGAFRILWERHEHEGAAYNVLSARSLASVERELGALRDAVLGGALVALLFAAGGGFWIARAALRPLSAMALQANAINERTPGRRLDPANPADELGQLARAFNELLARLESALAQQRRFMADASHELRTPVSVARSAAEVALSRDGRSEAEYRDALAVVAAQMRRLGRIVEDMFMLARADAAGLPLEPGPLYLDELVAGCVKEASLLGASSEVRVDWQGAEDLEARGDEQALRRLLMNLLDNAVRHSPRGGAVRVLLANGPDGFQIDVTDSAGGISPQDQQRIFERFVQLDESRRSSQGAGLGLPIARAIAEAHGGSLVLARSDASGSTFRVRLPPTELHVA